MTIKLQKSAVGEINIISLTIFKKSNKLAGLPLTRLFVIVNLEISCLSNLITMKELKQLTRGAKEVIGKETLEKKLKEGKTLRVKHGIDPTTDKLHLGYTVDFEVMRRFQKKGHKSVILFGDFTGRIGDPTDKEDPREGSTKDELQTRGKKLIAQLKDFFPQEGLEVRWNSEWWDKTSLKDFLEIAKNVSASRLFERDMFEKRLEAGKPVWTHELLYPILQGYDSVELEADLTVIGSDQKFNELVAREVQKEKGQDPQALVIMPILPGTDGNEKMSQSLENDIGIREEPYSMYSKLMSMPDSNILPYFKYITGIPPDKLKEFEQKLERKNYNPKQAKQKLALRIVSRYHSEKEAREAQKKFEKVFKKDELPSEITECKVNEEELLAKNLVDKSGLASSASEATRLIKQGGIKLDQEKIEDPFQKIKIPEEGIVLQRGKKKFIKVVRKQ